MEVIAYKSVQDDKVELYGYGTIDESRVPDAEPYSKMINRFGRQRTFGLITLESGRTLWSFQCLWAIRETFEKKRPNVDYVQLHKMPEMIPAQKQKNPSIIAPQTEISVKMPSAIEDVKLKKESDLIQKTAETRQKLTERLNVRFGENNSPNYYFPLQNTIAQMEEQYTRIVNEGPEFLEESAVQSRRSPIH